MWLGACLAWFALAGPPAASAGRQETNDVRAALDAGAYPNAERVASELVEQRERLYGGESLELSGALDLAVEASLRNGTAGTAHTLREAERAVHIKQEHLGLASTALAASLDNLGDVLTEQGELKAALQVCEKALTIRRQATLSADQSVADSLDRVALTLIFLQRFREAERALDESQRIRATGVSTLSAGSRSHLLPRRVPASLRRPLRSG